MGQSYSVKEGGIVSFTVTPSVSSGKMLFTVSDPNSLLTTSKMIRAVLEAAITAWLTTNKAQLVTNSVSVGNDPYHNTLGGPDVWHPAGWGFLNFDWNYSAKTAKTPAITTTSLTTAAIVVSVPFGDVS